MAKDIPRRLTSNREYSEMVRRIIVQQGRRVEDLPDLAELLGIRADLDKIIEDAVYKLRHEPLAYSWAEIGRALGITRQAAQQRWSNVGGARVVGGQPARLR
jgi:biotin operon repressor